MDFLYNVPAIFHKKTLIVGDTHFGIEQKIKKKGIHYSNFSSTIAERLEELIKETKAKKLVILGDVKDYILSMDETTERILNRFADIIDLTIVKGNHDGGIESLKWKTVDHLIIDNLGLVHGHSWPDKKVMGADYLVSAHQHPQIEMIDKLGKKHVEPAWFVLEPEKKNIKKHYNEFNDKIKLVLMPAFNPLVGSPIKKDQKSHLGPILNNNLFKLNDAIVYRLDGSCLGKLKNLRK